MVDIDQVIEVCQEAIDVDKAKVELENSWGLDLILF